MKNFIFTLHGIRFKVEFIARTGVQMLLRENQTEAALLITKTLAENLDAEGFHRRQFINDFFADEPAVAMFYKDSKLEQHSNMPAGGNFITIGAFSYSFTRDLVRGMQIGRYCSIAGGLQVFSTQHPMTGISTSAFIYDSHETSVAAELDNRGVSGFPFLAAPQKPAPIIENDVWIGMNVTLARGIRIGTGAIIGAGSVVTKYVPPYTIVGGNPAKFIRRRFADEICDRMLASRWWDYSFVDLGPMDIANPINFLERFEYVKSRQGLSPLTPKILDWDRMICLLDK
ncbi:CatB-related O-acetyltransferase [Methylobacterium goesingense]|uniref:Acetyltransferase-like isoleucine patch superfamily enzyme n=1 Tax=Methylobacterium goesingense TaxID=243690 RepID=A0ABV2L1D1_9HYPH|nr:CatB-related O-acetyltransferase [Methylobacterium goesingense]